MSRWFQFRLLWRDAALSLGMYVAALCPVAVLLGMLVCSIEQGARMPLDHSVANAGVYVLGFLVTASIGYVVATAFLPAPRSKLLTRRAWSVPVACAAAFSIATITGCVEQTTDVAERWIGQRHENLLMASTVIAWSAASTAVVLAIDRMLPRLQGPTKC